MKTTQRPKPKSVVKKRSNRRYVETSIARRLTRNPLPKHFDSDVIVEQTTLKVDEINVGEYQRAIRPQWVNAIANSFSAALFEPIHVALRVDNKYYVVDGQHRLEAAKKLGWTTIPVLLHLDLNERVEASLFVELQERRLGLSQVSRFHAGLIAKDPDALKIQQILNRIGWQMATVSTATQNMIACPAALSMVIKQYDESMLFTVLSILKLAWNGAPESLRASLIKGLALYIKEHQQLTVDPLLIKKFAERLHALKPTDLLLRAAVIRNTLGCTPHRAIAHVYNDVANMGRGIASGWNREA